MLFNDQTLCSTCSDKYIHAAVFWLFVMLSIYVYGMHVTLLYIQ